MLPVVLGLVLGLGFGLGSGLDQGVRAYPRESGTQSSCHSCDVMLVRLCHFVECREPASEPNSQTCSRLSTQLCRHVDL